MVMPDARVSQFASAMAEVVRRQQIDGLPSENGSVLVGAVADDGISLAWESFDLGPVSVVAPAGE